MEKLKSGVLGNFFKAEYGLKSRYFDYISSVHSITSHKVDGIGAPGWLR